MILNVKRAKEVLLYNETKKFLWIIGLRRDINLRNAHIP
jgi:hypothetical protein